MASHRDRSTSLADGAGNGRRSASLSALEGGKVAVSASVTSTPIWIGRQWDVTSYGVDGPSGYGVTSSSARAQDPNGWFGWTMMLPAWIEADRSVATSSVTSPRRNVWMSSIVARGSVCWRGGGMT